MIATRWHMVQIHNENEVGQLAGLHSTLKVDASRVLEINDPSLKFQYAVQKHMGFDDSWYKKHMLEINDPSRNALTTGAYDVIQLGSEDVFQLSQVVRVPMTIPPSWLLACPFRKELIVGVRASHSHLSTFSVSSSRVAGLPFPGGDVEFFLLTCGTGLPAAGE